MALATGLARAVLALAVCASHRLRWPPEERRLAPSRSHDDVTWIPLPASSPFLAVAIAYNED